ncbi:Dipeptide-binding protein ABC transporter, periplasmic substrate-binding protein component [Salipiger mucosus DSM 16094]|uniref:Dipeptide-binding protein ABC transporter, periplasmic substrate-binding protein component n=2 Tax=Salipiger mucosus TaxID=263378 RepID=S9Q3E5_9RHOB|nr:Dipeptide-binding protein ABC transporter, periplasmic substrate-binding protein component [Salipiger mucosus DSM 16094]
MKTMKATAGKAMFGLLVSTALTLTASAASARDLTVGLPGTVVTLDPHMSATVFTDLNIASHLYSALVTRGPDLELAPDAAEEWTATADTTWRFQLHPGVTFPNGEALDAEAVKWNIERVLADETSARIKPWFELVDEVNVIDKTTVDIVTSAPYPALPDQLSMFFLLPPEWSAENDTNRMALGTGPYDLVEFQEGNFITLSAKEDYWGTAPEFEEVTFRFIPEESTRISALLAGEVDFVTSIPTSEIERTNQNEGTSGDAVASTRTMFLRFNSKVEPFQGNAMLRRAMNYAVDKNLIIDSLWDGYGEVARCQPLSEDYFGYNPDLEAHPYDPEQARSLMVEAGYPDGFDLELDVPIGRYLQGSEIGQIVAAQLTEIGVNVQITETEWSRWLDKLYNDGMSQATYYGLAWPTLDAGGVMAFFEDGNTQNYQDDPEFTSILQEANSSVDADERLALYKTATERMCESAPILFLFQQPYTYGISDEIEWSARGDDWARAMDMSVAGSAD